MPPALLENISKFLISVGNLRRASKVGKKTKLIGSRIITPEFDNKSFWKFTTALGRKLPDGRLFYTKLFLTVWSDRPGPAAALLVLG